MASPGAAQKEEKSGFMDVKEVFRKGKAQTLNYALAVNKKRGEPPAFIVHKKKEGAQLLKAAKEKSGNKIGIIGTLTCTTKTFDLTVKEGKPTTMMAKQLRLFLKSNQLKQKVLIKAPDGSTIGDGEEEETTEEAVAKGTDQEETQTAPQEQAAAETETSEESSSSSQEQQKEDEAPSGDAYESAKQELKVAVGELDSCRKRAEELGEMRTKLEASSDADAQTAALNARGACREAKETADEAGTYLKEVPAMLKEAEKGSDEKLLAQALGEVHSAQEKLESSKFSADKADKMLAEYEKIASGAAKTTEEQEPAEKPAQAKEQEQPAAKRQDEAPAAAAAKKGKDTGPVKALAEQIKAEQKKTKKAVAIGEELAKLREKVAAQGDPDSEVAARNANGMVRDALEAAQAADKYIKDAMEQAKKAAKAGAEEEKEYIKEAESILGGIAQKLEEVDYSSERARAVLSSVAKESAQAGKGGDSKDQETQTAPRQAAEVPEELAKAVDNRKAFKKARELWVKTRDKAIEDLEQVKQGARNAYMDDIEQFPVVQRKLGDLDEILDNLNDDLRVTLDAYVSTPLRNQQKMQDLADEAKQLLGGYMSYVQKSPLLDGIDQKEFANVTMKAPLLKALKQLERAIV